jgi:6-phosphogluconolactonase
MRKMERHQKLMSNSVSKSNARSETPRLKIVEDLNEIARTAANEILLQVNRTATAATPFAMALSGGFTPRALYELMAGEPAVFNRLPWNRMHFFWGDERHVPPNHPQSNFRMADETLFSKAPVPLSNIHRVGSEDPDAAKAADNYEKEICGFFQLESGRLPQFNCVLLGMGSDGHTASLFPGTDALRETTRLAVANWVEDQRAFRITLTIPVLNNAELVIFLVSGQQKAQTLKQVFQGSPSSEPLPARRIRPCHGRLLWIVDRAAAGGLTKNQAGGQPLSLATFKPDCLNL